MVSEAEGDGAAMTRSEILQIAKPILFGTEMILAILDGGK